MSEPEAWWGDWRLDVGETRRWRVGPRELVIEHRRGEWRIGHSADDAPVDRAPGIGVEAAPEELDALPERRRFAWLGEGLVSLTPRTADRPIVFRPEIPITVLAGDEIELFVSSPVWIDVAAGSQAKPLSSLPVDRPSDTWLGPTPVEGELCYASRTHCRLHLVELPIRSHRAVTAVRVRNRTESPIPLDRISVPLPALAIHAHEGGLLSTSSVVLTSEDEADPHARLEVVEGPPSGSKARLLSPPRVEATQDRLVRAFAGLF